jgi:transcription factor C subunit 3
VSHLRRENEILRIIEEAGGTVNIQTKEFYDAHISLLETLSKAGEPTSAPVGTRTDKRTAALTIDGLESKGKLKQLKTSVITHTGIPKPANIVYLPTVAQEQLNAFLAEVGRGPQPSFTPSTSTVVKIQEAVNYGADESASSRAILPLQLLQLERPGEDKKERWSKNIDRANQLFTYDDDTIRNVLLTERTTHGQLYGFIVGKAARARALHLSLLEAFESEQTLPNIIPGSRIVDFTHFSQELPIRLFTSFVSALTPHNEELTALFSTEEGRGIPVKDLPPNLHTHLQVGRSRARSRILDIFVILRSLGLVTPLKPSASDEPWLTCSPHEKHPTAFDLHTDEGWTPSTPHAAPSYWFFNTEAPIYLWSLSDYDPPYWKTASVSTIENAKEYWQSLKDSSVDPYLPRVTISSNRPAGIPAPNLLASKTLRRVVSWNAEYVLTWHQMKFLERSIDVTSGDSALEDDDNDERATKVNRLCWVTSAPQKAVEDYLRQARVKMLNDKAKIINHNRSKEAKRLKKMEDSKNALARKAEEAKTNRQNQWTSLLEKIYPGDLGVAASRVERVHQRFMQAGTVKDLAKWEKELLDALREADLATKKILQVAGKRPVFPRPLTFTNNESPSATALSIKALIDQQQPLLEQGLYKRKTKHKKGKEKEAEGEHIPVVTTMFDAHISQSPSRLKRRSSAGGATGFSGTRSSTSSPGTRLLSSELDVAQIRGSTGLPSSRYSLQSPAIRSDNVCRLFARVLATNLTFAGSRIGGTASGSSSGARIHFQMSILRVLPTSIWFSISSF